MNADITHLLDTIETPFTDVPITDAEIAFADMCEAEQWTAANGIIYASITSSTECESGSVLSLTETSLQSKVSI